MTTNRIDETPEFIDEMVRLEEEFTDVQRRLQHAYMVSCVGEMADVCPNVVSFDLGAYHNGVLTTSDAQDVDGNLVNQEMQEQLESLFHYKEEADFYHYVGDRVNVHEIIDSWNCDH